MDSNHRRVNQQMYEVCSRWPLGYPTDRRKEKPLFPELENLRRDMDKLSKNSGKFHITA